MNLMEIRTADKRNFVNKTYIPPISYEDLLECFDIVLAKRIAFSIIAAFDYHELSEVAPVMRLKIAAEIKTRFPAAPIAIVNAEARHQLSRDLFLSRLKEAWRGVLGFSDIDSSSNFFSCGGDSISVLKLINVIRDTCFQDVHVADIYSFPTPAALTNEVFKSNELQDEDLDTRLDEILDNLIDDRINVEDALKTLERKSK